MSPKYNRSITLSRCLWKNYVICEIYSFFLAWARSSCVQESLMAQFEAQDIFICIRAYIKYVYVRDMTMVLLLTSVYAVQTNLA